MIDPERLLDATENDFERRLLRAAATDAGSNEALQHTLASLGAVAVKGSVAAGATAAALRSLHGVRAAGSLGSALTAGKILAWVAVGGLLGGLTTVGAEFVSQRRGPSIEVVRARENPRSPARTAPTAAPVTNDAENAAPALPSLPAAPSARRFTASAEARARSSLVPIPEEPSMDSPGTPPPSSAFAPTSAERGVAAAASSGTPSGTSALRSELLLLQRARAALGRGDGASALALLNAYEKQFPSGALSPEGTVLRVEALWLLGDKPDARDLAERFLASHRGSPHEARLRSLLSGGRIQ